MYNHSPKLEKDLTTNFLLQDKSLNPFNPYRGINPSPGKKATTEDNTPNMATD